MSLSTTNGSMRRSGRPIRCRRSIWLRLRVGYGNLLSLWLWSCGGIQAILSLLTGIGRWSTLGYLTRYGDARGLWLSQGRRSALLVFQVSGKRTSRLLEWALLRGTGLLLTISSRTGHRWATVLCPLAGSRSSNAFCGVVVLFMGILTAWMVVSC